MDEIYMNLAAHLDRLPGGFPKTESGVELRILRRLFSPAEAEVATCLQLSPETADIIAARAGIDSAAMADMLEAMSRKGLILRSEKDGVPLYMAAQFMIGIWEYHVNELNEGLIRDVNEYIPHLMKERWGKQKTRQLRVIPVSASIRAEIEVMPYEVAEKIISAQSKIVVAPCICRKEHHLMGKGCNNPMETCLIFGGSAYYYERNGIGRSISIDTALDILRQGMESGLVLQPGNAQKPSNICMCCGCCCQILKNIKTFEHPADVVCTSYYAEVESETCIGCGACVEKCQMNAIEMDETARVDIRRCIGCGLCVAACETDAVHLVQKENQDRWVPPKNTAETYLRIIAERRSMNF
ncbi:MAG: 4Fe-4S dicluster domain-containing protein [Thermodesulfobacteriota bacterium]